MRRIRTALHAERPGHIVNLHVTEEIGLMALVITVGTVGVDRRAVGARQMHFRRRRKIAALRVAIELLRFERPSSDLHRRFRIRRCFRVSGRSSESGNEEQHRNRRADPLKHHCDTFT